MFSLIRLSAAAAMRVDYLRANEEAVAAILLEQVLQHREVFDEVLSDSLHYFSLQTTMREREMRVGVHVCGVYLTSDILCVSCRQRTSYPIIVNL